MVDPLPHLHITRRPVTTFFTARHLHPEVFVHHPPDPAADLADSVDSAVVAAAAAGFPAVDLAAAAVEAVLPVAEAHGADKQ